MSTDIKYFHHDLTLSPQSSPSSLLFPAKLAYLTFGSPTNPAILLPTCYGGTLSETSTFLYSHPNGPLPSSHYYIIVVGLLGGSESSSPSNQSAPYSGSSFPHTTYADNIALQVALLDHLNITHLHAYIGFSMGGQQAYHFAVMHPTLASHIVCIAGSARTSTHNWAFLDGLRHVLEASGDYEAGQYSVAARNGTRAFMRAWATWGTSAAWFAGRCWEELGFKTVEEYLGAYWDGEGDARDLLAMLWTWQRGDVGVCFPEDGGVLGKTLGRIQAKVLVMPTRTDAYFVPEESEEEVKWLKNGGLRVVETVWGHIAGGGSGTKEDVAFMQEEIGRFVGAKDPKEP